MGEINETSEQFSQKIADLQSELEMIQGVNPHIVRRYEDLKKDVGKVFDGDVHQHTLSADCEPRRLNAYAPSSKDSKREHGKLEKRLTGYT